MKLLSVLVFIFFVAACGNTSSKKKSSDALLAACDSYDDDFVSHYEYVALDTIEYYKNEYGCFTDTAWNCTYTIYDDAKWEIEYFKNEYPGQTGCSATISGVQKNISINDFEDELAIANAYLNQNQGPN